MYKIFKIIPDENYSGDDYIWYAGKKCRKILFDTVDDMDTAFFTTRNCNMIDSNSEFGYFYEEA
jgi:hypothetical protein